MMLQVCLLEKYAFCKNSAWLLILERKQHFTYKLSLSCWHLGFSLIPINKCKLLLSHLMSVNPCHHSIFLVAYQLSRTLLKGLYYIASSLSMAITLFNSCFHCPTQKLDNFSNLPSLFLLIIHFYYNYPSHD